MKKILLSIISGFLLLFPGQIQASENQSNDFLIINKANNKLALYKDGELEKVFSVATGAKPTYTPEGKFKIVNKIKNRPYYTKQIPGGSPLNPLGDRWLGLNANGTNGDTYAVHGNSNENSIGKYVSHGCVRMHNQEVRWLYEQVKVNTPVLITRSTLSFDEIAKKNGFTLNQDDIKNVNKIIYVDNNTVLYSKPSKSYPTNHSLASQKVNTVAQAGSWYKIKSFEGELWVKGKEVEGDVASFSVKSTTFLYDSPFQNERPRAVLAPQTIQSIEKAEDWIKIKTWYGYGWLKLNPTK